MIYSAGSQRLTGVGNLNPTGSALRITGVHAHSTLSASSLSFYGGLDSTSDLYMVFSTDSQGNIHETGMDAYFPDGVWINTGAAGTITTIITFGAVQA